jgi:catechol 2,3-dioxygenase-like lactoylglutathione lyase family enzyme
MSTIRLFATTAFAAVLAAVAAPAAIAQLTAANDGPVVYGHHHLLVSNLEEHKAFWIDTMGGRLSAFGPNTVATFSNVHVFLREQVPTGGTKGTTVNHIGFSVPDLPATLAIIRAAGYPIVTREELPPALAVVDDIAHVANPGIDIAFVMAPDDVKIEIVENPGQSAPITLHHVHFATQQVEEMRAWYAETFGAIPGVSGAFQVAELPGVILSYIPSTDPLAGTQGRSLDHIGFEIDGLEAFCRELEAQGVVFDRPYTVLEGRGLALAYFTDPFGTYIELTEGLDNL